MFVNPWFMFVNPWFMFVLNPWFKFVNPWFTLHKYLLRRGYSRFPVFSSLSMDDSLHLCIMSLSSSSKYPSMEILSKVVKAVFVYLNATREDGLVYWRKTPRDDLPSVTHPQRVTPDDILRAYPDSHDLSTLARWRYRCNMGGRQITPKTSRRHHFSIRYAGGGAVYYKCRYLPTIALSSTEAKFASMADAGKAALYLRSLLSDMGFTQDLPTEIQADSRSAMQMATAQQPTCRTRHIVMKQFVILQWSGEDLISSTGCPSAVLVADSMTKHTGRTKFYEHMDIMLWDGDDQSIRQRTPQSVQ